METSRSDPSRRPPLESNARKDGDDAVERGRFEVAGHRLYFELHGSTRDPVVVFLHHGLGSIRSWRRQIPAFVAAGWRTLVYDRWGYGRSDPRPTFLPGFLRQDAAECLALLNHLGVERASLVGHSDGGTIAILLAAQRPERVRSMVLVAAHIYYEPKMEQGLHGIAAAAKEPPLATVLAREHGERADALVEAWIDHWLGSEPAALSLRKDLKKIVCPVFVIQGELDEHATPKHAQDIAEAVRDGHLWLIPGVHHMPLHEIPERFNRRVLKFLSQETNPTAVPDEPNEGVHV
jgi:pimeloyl-ACP methyl ester carboxylesterase